MELHDNCTQKCNRYIIYFARNLIKHNSFDVVLCSFDVLFLMYYPQIWSNAYLTLT